LICVLSLDLADHYYGYLGCPIQDSARLRPVASSFLQKCIDSCDPIEKHADEFISDLRKEFGLDQQKSFLQWTEIVWNQLDGPAWDWFAYQFAFSRWHNAMPEIFDFGEKTATVSGLFREHYLEPVAAFRREAERWIDLPISYWDQRILEYGNWRLAPAGQKVAVDFSAVLFGPVRGACFQGFWRVLVEQLGGSTLVSSTVGVERLVRAETAFPARAMLMPTELPIVSSY
jgi:hypothetical protein